MVYYVYAMCVCVYVYVAAHRLASDQIYARSIASTDPWRALAAALVQELNADGTDNTGAFENATFDRLRVVLYVS